MWNKIVRRMSRREMAVLGLLLSVCFLTCGLMQFFSWGQTQLGTGELLCADTLRFHIRAESDSLLDQSIKLYVRDAILAYTDAFCTSADKPDALRWAARNLPQFQLTAQQVLASLGLHSPVRVRLVNMYFNQTRYQSSALPARRSPLGGAEPAAVPADGTAGACVAGTSLAGTGAAGEHVLQSDSLSVLRPACPTLSAGRRGTCRSSS